MRLVLDATAFFLDLPLEGELYTTPSVVAELADLSSKCRYEALLARGLRVQEPGRERQAEVEKAASGSGDSGVLSGTDRDLLSLALEVSAAVATDDFAVQNVAQRLGLRVRTLQQRRARPRQWRYRCTGCGKYSEEPGDCPVCGAEVKRTIK